MKEIINNVFDGCPPMSFEVLEHIQHAVGETILWDTKLRSYGGSMEKQVIRVRGKFGKIGDKMDFTGKIHAVKSAD